MSLDLTQIRNDAPACTQQLFFNSAGASLPPLSVHQTMRRYLDLEDQEGGYAVAALHQEALDAFYTEAARLLHTSPRNIAFCSSATDAYARALSAIPFRAGDVIVTTDDDYISNQIGFMSLHKRFGVITHRIRKKPDNSLDLEHAEVLLRTHRPVLVAVTHIPTNSGLIQDVAAMGVLSRQYGAWYLVDGCQSVGQMDVNAPAIGADFLSATGRKFMRGPRGTGLLYVSDRALDSGLEPLGIDMRGAVWTAPEAYAPVPDAKRFEYWEFSWAALLGLAEAIRYANTLGMNHIEARTRALSAKLRAGLAALPQVEVLDRGEQLGGIVTFRPASAALAAVEQHLQQHRVKYSVSRRANALIDFSARQVDWAIRLSPHYFNTEEEVAAVLEVVGEIK